MKKISKIRLILSVVLAVALSLFAFSACTPDSGDNSTAGGEVKTPVMAFESATASVNVHETLVLRLTHENLTEKITWTSSNTSVATVFEGVVSGVAEGSATITASSSGISATCSVAVRDTGAAPVLVLSQNQVSLDKNQNYEISLAACYNGKEVSQMPEFSWQVKEGSASLASVSNKTGGKATVSSGNEYGTVVYTVSATVYGVVLAEDLTVKVVDTSVTFQPGEWTNYSPEGLSMRLSMLKTDENNSSQINVAVYKDEVLQENANLDWTVSSGSEFITFAGGVLTASREGKAVLSAVYNNVEVLLNVYVYRPEIKVDSLVYVERLSGSGTGSLVLDGENLGGEITGLKLGGADIYASHSGKTVGYNRSKLPASKAEMGKKVLTVDTDQAQYVFDCEYCTQAIATAADFNKMGDYATAVAGKGYDGYFVLTDDIDFGGVKYVSALSNTQAGAFCGILNGNGHAISNLTVDVSGPYGWYAAFIKLGEGAVIKNVALINAVSSSVDTFVNASGLYSLENVYVELTFKGISWGANVFGAVAEKGFKAKNVLVKVGNTDAANANKNNTYNLAFNQCVTEGYLNNVYQMQ